VSAKRWEQGWELHVAGEGVTQAKTLSRAKEQVRDYLESLHGVSFADAEIYVEVDLDGYEKRVQAARAEVSAAANAQRVAAEHSRDVVVNLRRMGLSVSDTAAVMNVSKGRVSQLAAAV
jgi:DNA-directed RNA polymerase specialized sigma subunit